jgi:hypothetical protein
MKCTIAKNASGKTSLTYVCNLVDFRKPWKKNTMHGSKHFLKHNQADECFVTACWVSILSDIHKDVKLNWLPWIAQAAPAIDLNKPIAANAFKNNCHGTFTRCIML